ncbi:MAG TPA: potassium channel protein [Bacteroidetes bacterium]|nr:potassium channel protein [Bacteroidota bacterium]
MKIIKRPHFYTLPSNFLNLRLALVLIVGEIVIGTIGFMVIEDYTLMEAFYMVIITVSTVGYGEVQPLDAGGQLFATILILSNFGIFAYGLATFSYYVTSGELFKKWHFSMIGKKVKQLEDHVIVCGYGRYGREVSANFKHHNIPFVVVEKSKKVIAEIQHSREKLLYLHEDATKDEVLQEAGIGKAKALITALPDDSENLFIVLTARQLNKKINIISRASETRSQRKLELAGADHVIMPEQIGGFYMATLVSKPGATEFFSYITRELESDIEFEELTYEAMPNSCHGRAIKDLNIRKETGTNIIAYRPPEGNYIVNPSPDTVLVPGASFIVLGNREQLATLNGYLNRI